MHGKLAKKIRNQRANYDKHECAVIPEQGSLCKLEWLMSEVAKFKATVAMVKAEWDEFAIAHAKQPMTKDLHKSVRALCDKWQKKHKIGTILGDHTTNHEDYNDEKDGMHQVDFRVWHVLHDTVCVASKKRLKQMGELECELRKDIDCLFGKQKEYPEMAELALLAWGTFEQTIHVDYGIRFGKADTDELQKKPSAKGERGHWFGTLIHHFQSTDDKKIAPYLLHEPDNMDAKRQLEKVAIPQGWTCLFGPHYKHAGGVHDHPFVRLHVHFDPLPNWGYPPRVRNQLHIPHGPSSPKQDTKRKRDERAAGHVKVKKATLAFFLD